MGVCFWAPAILLHLNFSECPGCGVQTNDPDVTCSSECGYIVSPGYPLTYDNSMKASWTIEVESQHYIKLQFLAFDLYEHPLLECERDVIAVIDFNLLGQPSNPNR